MCKMCRFRSCACALKVSPGPLLSFHTFGCARWSELTLSAYAWRQSFACRGQYYLLTVQNFLRRLHTPDQFSFILTREIPFDFVFIFLPVLSKNGFTIRVWGKNSPLMGAKYFLVKWTLFRREVNDIDRVVFFPFKVYSFLLNCDYWEHALSVIHIGE